MGLGLGPGTFSPNKSLSDATDYGPHFEKQTNG